MNKAVVLDIETFPDAGAIERAGVDVADGFPARPLHQLACVSLLTIERNAMAHPTFKIETFSRAEMSERGIVASTEQAIANAQEVITYNGRGFDLPVLMTRAALTGEHVPTLSRMSSQSRYRPGLHADLLDEVTSFGAAPRIRLADICAAFSIPVKVEAHGSDVASLVERGEWDSIRRYCETDVVATWIASLFWRSVQRGALEQAVEDWTSLAYWIRDNQPRLAHLLPYAGKPAFFAGGPALRELDFSAISF